MTWLIARRAAVEAIQDRLSFLVGLFFAVVVPLALLIMVIRPSISIDAPGSATGGVLAFYLLLVSVLPGYSAVGIAAGQFAGEKERGLLTPLLASPASNLSIFAGKVLGAIMPPLAYAVAADTVYVVGITLLIGPATVGMLPLAAVLTTLVLVPAVTWLAAVVASLISSRVRTFNAAQQLAGLALTPVWAAVFGIATWMQQAGPIALVGGGALLLLIDVAVTGAAARTWQREEVLAHR